MKNKKTLSWIGTIFFTILGLIYIAPIIIVLLNSFKKKSFINLEPFKLPSAKNFIGLDNYTTSLNQYGLLKAVGWTVFITVGSVIVILICTSMCAWAITRVKNKFTNAFYLLCVFSMVVPFQMVMFTLSLIADRLKLNTPWGIIIIYLGFGAGLAVFMFTGFVKGIPLEIEEAALIDGCNPLQVFFKILIPILKPTIISTAILQLMWVWNDYLLPTLVLDIKKYRTIPMAVQYFRGSFGHVQMGPMASIMIDIIPIVIVYLVCQKYIIEGVVAGAVKG